MSSPNNNRHPAPHEAYRYLEVPTSNQEPKISILRQLSSSSTIPSIKTRLSFSRSDSSSSKSSGHATDVPSSPSTPSAKTLQPTGKKENQNVKRFSLQFGFFDSASTSSRTPDSTKSADSSPTQPNSTMQHRNEQPNEKRINFNFGVFNPPRLTNPLSPQEPNSENEKPPPKSPKKNLFSWSPTKSTPSYRLSDLPRLTTPVLTQQDLKSPIEPEKETPSKARFSWSPTKSALPPSYRLSYLPRLTTPIQTQQNLESTIEKEEEKKPPSSKRLTFPFTLFDTSSPSLERKKTRSWSIATTPTQPQPEPQHIELLIYTCHHSETVVKPMRDYTTYTMVPHMCTPCVEWIQGENIRGWKKGGLRRKSIGF
ncbi:hypothetical protein FPQ18DRAFT_310059 [Pyronema domesticum]|nr:hypothetical protein FPQ18DRAFT_310059 [Pyronema domesticum]